MNWNTWLLALNAFLLSAVVLQLGNQNTPDLITIPVLFIMFLMPIWLIGYPIFSELKPKRDLRNQ